jgi:hypothetical protein
MPLECQDDENPVLSETMIKVLYSTRLEIKKKSSATFCTINTNDQIP